MQDLEATKSLCSIIPKMLHKRHSCKMKQFLHENDRF
jgi:hypothetical protein